MKLNFLDRITNKLHDIVDWLKEKRARLDPKYNAELQIESEMKRVNLTDNYKTALSEYHAAKGVCDDLDRKRKERREQRRLKRRNRSKKY